MKTAVPGLTAGMAVFLLLCGCATSIETPIYRPQPCAAPETLRVGVLPPRIHPDLEKHNLKAEEPFCKQLMDGRGMVVTSATPSNDIGLGIVSTLTQAGKYRRIFTVENEEDARRAGADALLTVTVWDYRTVLLGSNRNYFWMVITSPLLSPYWLQWRTLEARFEWEVKLTSTTDGSVLYRKRLKRSYTAPVRSAYGHYFTDKMLSFLQNRTAPGFIGELFDLKMLPLPPERSSSK